jgi:hypothetical protein
MEGWATAFGRVAGVVESDARRRRRIPTVITFDGRPRVGLKLIAGFKVGGSVLEDS